MASYAQFNIQDQTPRIQVNLAHPQHIAKALIWHQGGLDFADALHLAASNGQDSFATFDQSLIKTSAQLGTTPKVFAP